jgi:GT2 family glycosyltransferase
MAEVDVDISAIVINYNGGDLLTRCLAAVRATGAERIETIVVDNGSTDGSLDALPAQLAPTTLVRAGQNLGFARAVGVATAHARGRWWLLLNTDCFLHPGAVQALVARLDVEPQAAVVGPRLLEADGSLQRSCHDFPSPRVFFLEQSSLWRLLVGRRSARRLTFAGDHDRPRPVDWVTGACWLVRPEAWHAVGGFDQRFFFYFEETELCYRLAQEGWQTWFEPAARATHLGGGSSDAPALLAEYFRGLDRFYRTHCSATARVGVRAMVVGMAAFKAARAVLATPLSRDATSRRRALRTARAWAGVLRT